MSGDAELLASGILPIASGRASWRRLRELLRRQRRLLSIVIAVQFVASAAGLIGPYLLENIINGAQVHLAQSAVTVAILLFSLALVVQTVLTALARALGAVLGEGMLAQLRQGLLAAVLEMPLGVVERAGTGDLMTRASTDVDDMSQAVRAGLPQLLVAAVTAVLATVALILTAPPLALALVPSIPIISLGTRWYLGRAREAYQRQAAAFARVNAGVQETVAAARAVEALRRGPERILRTEDDVREWVLWERRTLWMRIIFFGTSEVSYVIPLVLCVLLGGWLSMNGHLTVGAVTAAALYAQQLVVPVDTLLAWQDQVQLASASLSRVLGVSEVPAAQTTDALPTDRQLVARGLHYAYRGDRDVLVDVDMAPPLGSRLAIVGPSGAGKSTLALLLAGIHAPRQGMVQVGGVPPHLLPAQRLRHEVALVTQEHHIFACSLRDNLRMARRDATDSDLLAVLDAVDARDLVAAMPQGLDTRVGSGGVVLGPGLAQQIAIARLLLADPHTLVLDEATSLLDSRAARHLERSISRLLDGRTVIAVSHRLHAAHDATVVAVMEAGRISEIGSHAELLAAGGAYAALWHSWQGEGPATVAEPSPRDGA